MALISVYSSYLRSLAFGYPYGIGPNPYVTSILTLFLTQECVHKPFLRSPKMTSKSGYWSLLPCSNLRGRQGQPFSDKHILS